MTRVHLTRWIVLLTALTLASGGATSLQSQQRRGPLVRMPAYAQPIMLDTMRFTRSATGASKARTFVAMREVYEALKLPVDYSDPANGHIGSLQLRISRRIGGERMSKFFNCGRGMTGDHADSWRLTIAAVSYIEASGDDDATVGTALVAQAQDMSGASTQPVRCGTTGMLEIRMLEMLRERVADSSPKR